jgi:hypothetical protein
MEDVNLLPWKYTNIIERNIPVIDKDKSISPT